MSNLSPRIWLIGTAVVLAVTALILPSAVSAWFLNSASTKIARSESMPHDASDRLFVLNDADIQLNQARAWSNNARVALGQARVKLERGDATGAAHTLAGKEMWLGSDAIAQWIWASAAWQSGQSDDAYEHWRSAGAFVFFIQQAHQATFDHQWQPAVEFARIAVGIDPNSADAHYVLGDALARISSENPEAMHEIDCALDLTHDNEFLSTLLSRKAEILEDQGQWQSALEYFGRARQAAPIDARPRTGYALTLLHINPAAYDQALVLLTQVVNDSPWYTAAFIALADINASHGDLASAEAWLQKGLVNNPNDARLLFPLGEFYARQGRLTEAKVTLLLAQKYETHADDMQAIEHALTDLGTR